MGWAAVAAAVALVVSGCTGEPDDGPTAPSFSPVPSPTESAPSASPEPSPEQTADTATAEALVAPELPPEATEETPEGAAAFAEWWFETLNYATATGDTEALRAAFVEPCGTCENFAVQAEEAYASGGRIEGGRIDVEVDVPPQLEEGGVTLAVFVDAASGRVLDAEGRVTEEMTAEELASAMVVVFVDDQWQVGGIQ